MNKRSLTLIGIGLISVIVISSVLAYELGFIKSNVPSGTFPNVLWQRPIEHFANNLAVIGGKILTTDDFGNLDCFSSLTGESIWNASLESRYSTIVVAGNQVYVGFQERKVGLLDVSTGKLLWTFQNEQAPNSIFKGPPGIVVKNSRLFAISDVVSGHNATTGELLWQAIPYGVNSVGTIMPSNNTWSGGWVGGFPLGGDAFDDNYVYATETDGNYSKMYFFKLNTDDGVVVWRSSITWDGAFLTFGVRILPDVVAIAQGQIIIGNRLNNQLISLDSSTGAKLWSMYVGTSVYNPTVYNDLLLFGAGDGNFYAVNLADGRIAWKTKVDTQNVLSLVNSTIYAQTSPIRIDSQNQLLFWGFGIGSFGVELDNYTGTLCSLDIANGATIWTKQIENKGVRGLVLNKQQIFLTEDKDLWIFNALKGDIVQSQRFDHYVLPPIVHGDEMFVAADLWLFAYS